MSFESPSSKLCNRLVFIWFYFFSLSPLDLSGTFAVGLFFFFFPYVVRRGSGVLSPATHAHPLFSCLLFLDDTTRTQQHTTSMGSPSGRDSNPADLAVASEECLFLPPPYRQPLIDIHTHPWPGGGSFLGKNPPPSVRFEPTSAGTATSEHCLRQPCGHRATLFGSIF
jgi:hypothetical protein